MATDARNDQKGNRARAGAAPAASARPRPPIRLRTAALLAVAAAPPVAVDSKAALYPQSLLNAPGSAAHP